MQTNPKQLILAAGLAITVACAGLAGCASEDRTAGTRLDDHMTERRIKKELADAPAYKFDGVRVDVYDGIAQLSGFVDTPEQKQYAGKITSQVAGVREVLDGISVKPPEIVTPTGYRYSRPYPEQQQPAATIQPNTPSANVPTQKNLSNPNPNTSNPNQP